MKIFIKIKKNKNFHCFASYLHNPKKQFLFFFRYLHFVFLLHSTLPLSPFSPRCRNLLMKPTGIYKSHIPGGIPNTGGGKVLHCVIRESVAADYRTTTLDLLGMWVCFWRIKDKKLEKMNSGHRGWSSSLLKSNKPLTIFVYFVKPTNKLTLVDHFFYKSECWFL